jgi:hypothetical protein
MRMYLLGIVALVAILSLPGAVNANLITDPGFEAAASGHDIGAQKGIDLTGTGWSEVNRATSPPGNGYTTPWTQNFPMPGPNQPPYTGTYSDSLTSNTRAHAGDWSFAWGNFDSGLGLCLDQSVATNSSTKYDIDFWVQCVGGGGNPDEFLATFGGTTLIDLKPSGPLTYQHVSVTGIAGQAGTTLLEFAGLMDTGGPADAWYLDDVNVVAESQQVPEPMTMSLLALGGLALLRRRS